MAVFHLSASGSGPWYSSYWFTWTEQSYDPCVKMSPVKNTLLYSFCAPDSTCEGHLGITVHALLLDAVLVGFGTSPWSLHVAEVLPPPLTTGVFLQPFLFSSPILKPNLKDKKDETCYWDTFNKMVYNTNNQKLTVLSRHRASHTQVKALLLFPWYTFFFFYLKALQQN